MDKLNKFFNQALEGLFNIFKVGSPAVLRLAVFISLLIASACFGTANPTAIGSYLGMAVILTVLAPDIRESFRSVNIEITAGALLFALVGFANFPVGVPFVGIFTLIIGIAMPGIIYFLRSPRSATAMARAEARHLVEELTTSEPKVISKTAQKNYQKFLARKSKGKK